MPPTNSFSTSSRRHVLLTCPKFSYHTCRATKCSRWSWTEGISKQEESALWGRLRSLSGLRRCPFRTTIGRRFILHVSLSKDARYPPEVMLDTDNNWHEEVRYTKHMLKPYMASSGSRRKREASMFPIPATLDCAVLPSFPTEHMGVYLEKAVRWKVMWIVQPESNMHFVESCSTSEIMDAFVAFTGELRQK